jgi:hypothetical protein
MRLGGSLLTIGAALAGVATADDLVAPVSGWVDPQGTLEVVINWEVAAGCET